MKNVNDVLIIIGLAFLWLFIFSFIIGDIKIFEWEQEKRAGVICLWIFSSIGVISLLKINN